MICLYIIMPILACKIANYTVIDKVIVDKRLKRQPIRQTIIIAKLDYL